MASVSKRLMMSAEKESASKTMKVMFVRPPNGEKITPQMQDAFRLASEDRAEWIYEEDIDDIDKDTAQNSFFICQCFSGNAFDKLKMMNFRIVGPQCVTMCIHRQEPIPRVKHPMLYSTMSGLRVCCTSICRDLRLDLHKKIQMMGGDVMKELTSRVTHLVCGEVGSKKYLVACKLQIKIMLPSWVEECYKRSSNELTHAADPLFDRFRCPVFYGFNITVSNLDLTERKEVEKLVTENGGIYSGELRVDVTTHLILIEPQGCKYKVAKQKNIPCLKLAWIQDSIEKGFCLDHNLYLIDDGVNSTMKTAKIGSSTPVKNQGGILDICELLPNCSTLSSINCTINETAMTNASVVPNMSSVSFNVSENKESNDAERREKWLDVVDLTVVSKSGLFLDGCKILLSGFLPSTTEKMRKILNLGGATRLNQLNDSVSHVIVGNKLEADHKKLIEEQFNPHVVHIGWIVESLKLNKPAEESKFRFTSADFQSTNRINSSTLSLNSLQNDTLNDSPSKTKTTINADTHSGIDDEFDDVITQYMDKIPVFYGLTFGAAGFNQCDMIALKEMVNENGGEFCGEPSTTTVVDYGIVPIPACRLGFKALHVATNYWLQNCVIEGKLLDIAEQPIYGPIEVDLNAKPLASCVLCFSQYSGAEKECLVHIAMILGAKCQDYFTRQVNRSRGLIPNTHLVAMQPEGSKYDGAIAWGIPVVSASWLINCLTKGTKLSESSYFVEKDVDKTNDQSDIENRSAASPFVKATDVVPRQHENIHFASGLVGDTSSVMRSFTTSDLKTPIRTIRYDASKKDVFQTPSSPASKLPSTAERMQTMREDLKNRYNFSCLKNIRVKDLVNADGDVSNVSIGSSVGDASVLDTPSKFMNPDNKYEPKLNFREVMSSLETPERKEPKDVSPTSLLSIEELFSLRLRQALRSEVKGSDGDKWQHILDPDESIDEKKYLLSLRPLTGIIIAVSKKLASEQGELNSIAEKLGAKCKWLYEKSCTHFVYRGKANETSKELKIAKDDKKIIVSPEWIRACLANHSRVDENSYPFTYNPNMSLQVVNQRNTTPLRNSQKPKEADILYSGESAGVTTPHNKVPADKINNKRSSNKADDLMRKKTDRKLDEILAATKVAKDRRKKGLNQSGGSNINLSSSVETPKINKLQSTPQTNVSNQCSSQVTESIPITWDDPSSREERAMLAARLKHNKSSNDNIRDVDDENIEEQIKTKHNQNERTPSFKENSLTRESLSPVFMFTCMRNEERQQANEIVTKCGGRVIDSQNFDTECTHLVTSQPSRSEKFLSGIAAGLWVLHSSYLQECMKKGRFVDEDAYEWGNDLLREQLPADNVKLCCAARRWRMELQSRVTNGSRKVGAFDDWKVVMCVSDNRVGGIRRVLEAGGAVVLSTRPPFTSIEGITHALTDDRTFPSTVDLRSLVAGGVLCLKPDFVWAFLSDGPTVNVKNYYLPEVRSILSSSRSSDDLTTKRKSDDTELNAKRTRQI